MTLGLSKYLSPEKAQQKFSWWLDIKNRLQHERPELAAHMLGLDSVGHESGQEFSAHESIYQEAYKRGEYVGFHVGNFGSQDKL